MNLYRTTLKDYVDTYALCTVRITLTDRHRTLHIECNAAKSLSNANAIININTNTP
jgi:hypothetical protein